MRLAVNSSAKTNRFTSRVKLKAVLEVMTAADGESETTREVASKFGVKPGTLAGWVQQVEARMDWLFEKTDPPELLKALIQRGRASEVRWAIRKACDRVLGPPCEEQPDDLDMAAILRVAKSICPRVKLDIRERLVLAELMGNGGDLPTLPEPSSTQTGMRPRGPKMKISDQDLERAVKQLSKGPGGAMGYHKTHEELRKMGVTADKERIRAIVNGLKGKPTKYRSKKARPGGEGDEGADLRQSLAPSAPITKRKMPKPEPE